MTRVPDLADAGADLTDEIQVAAESGPSALVHSDLHREHLLVGDDGTLAGVLALVAARYLKGEDELKRGMLLALAVGV